MYENLEFPVLPDRPYFYINFVATLDGKADVPSRHGEYWPIGSAADFKAFINLRVPADALIHGRVTATMHRTVDNLAQPEFKAARAAKGKIRDLVYIVASAHPDEALKKQIANEAGIEPLIADGKDLGAWARELKRGGIGVALLEGGPHITASFFAAGLVDEIFLTLAPKVFGGGDTRTLTMAEGPLLPPDQLKEWELVSATPLGNEMFLRYRKPAG